MHVLIMALPTLRSRRARAGRRAGGPRGAEDRRASMNSHRCDRPDSLASGISRMRMRMASTIAFLYSKPPSSRSTLDRKFMSARYFCAAARARSAAAARTRAVPCCAGAPPGAPFAPHRRRMPGLPHAGGPVGWNGPGACRQDRVGACPARAAWKEVSGEARRRGRACGNLRHSARMASTTTILNSSAMSVMNEPICLSRRSTLLSLPVLSSVVMASVAMLRFWSLMRLSMSMLQLVTASGCVIATCARARDAAAAPACAGPSAQRVRVLAVLQRRERRCWGGTARVEQDAWP